MPSLAEFQANRRELVIEWLGTEITLSYRPAVLTPAFEERMRGLSAGGDEARAAFTAGLVELIDAWDLTVTDDDPVPIPITPAGLAEVPSMILGGIYTGIQEDSELGKVVKGSRRGSRRTASSVTSPTGTP